MLGRAVSVDLSTDGFEKISTALKRQRLESSSVVEDYKRKERRIVARGQPEEDIWNKERQKQVITGNIKVKSSNTYNILLIADSWPSFAVDHCLASKESQFWIHCPNGPTSSIELMPNFCKWLSRDEAMQVAASEICSWIVIQGKASFINEALSTYLFSSKEKKNILCLLPAIRLRKFKILTKTITRWKKIKHSDLGGVTLSHWLIGISIVGTTPDLPSLDALLPSFGLQRRLLDIVKPTEKGSVVRVHNIVPQIPDHIDLLNLPSRSFELPSVFSYTGWVRRTLANKELGSVVDLPELFVAKVLETLEDDCILIPESLALFFQGNVPPLKIIQVARTLLDYFESPKDISPLADSSMEVIKQFPSGTGLIDFHQEKTEIVVNVPSDSAARYLALYGQKSAKDDNASVPVELWNGYLFEKHLSTLLYDPFKHGTALEMLRNKFALRIYRRNISKSFFKYLRTTYGEDWLSFYQSNRTTLNSRKRKREGTRLSPSQLNLLKNLVKDLAVGLDGLKRVLEGSWWEWDKGSTLFFWRWPVAIRKAARDGVPVFVEGRLPRYRRKQRLPKETYMKERMIDKLTKVTQRKYVEPGSVLSLINCFAVPKGQEDIRLVYDGTKSGLNAAVWAPNFFMPSPDSALMWVDSLFWFADLDLGEMFLNYFMDERIREYSGVDLTGLLGKEGTDWRRWGRTFMGFSPSPYNAVKLFGWTIDMIHGDRWCLMNPYRWNGLLVNLPGASNYNPSKPRICKTWNDIIAAILEAYVDDVRVMGSNEIVCREATRRASQILQYLGQQDACRKYRPPHTSPGPWCGSFVAVQDESVWVYVSDEKWNKAKTFIRELSSLVAVNELIPFKFLERGRGFMVYFCRTYPSFTPFLKGIHLTMDVWRAGRNEEGWKNKKFNKKEQEHFIRDLDMDVEEVDGLKEAPDPLRLNEVNLLPVEETTKAYEDHPSLLPAVPRLAKDLKALDLFLASEKVPWRFVRGNKICVAIYGFGDASKAGFGSTLEEGNGSIWFRLGVWGCSLEEESSNFRELTNLVESIEERIKEGGLNGSEIFLFTDNSTAEAAFYKGTSSSEKLFEAILRLRLLEVKEGVVIHFIHVAGTRMIAQGTDGLSRGDLGEGIMNGGSMLSYIPLHLNALERSPELKQWIVSWLLPNDRGEEITFLNYEGWFERGHDIIGGKPNCDGIWTPQYARSTYVWTPPPAGGLIAVEQLRRARLKREWSTHVVIIPRLMSAEWKKQLFRVSDLFIELPFDEFWKKNVHHEPLIFAVVFPFLSHRPWQLKRSPAFLGLGNVLRSLWKEDSISTGTVLRKLFTQQRKLASMSEGMVRKMLQGPGNFGFLHPQRGE